ncbi:MAG: hypothetical protein HYV14_09850 [Elusimicrobia bacterium]|nr:hypothetical protein [Elusimicrobiota bacterium]
MRTELAAAAIATILTLASAARAEVYSVPAFPVTLRFTADAQSPFCSSAELSRRIAPYFATIGGTELQYPDLDLRCETHDAERVRFRLIDENGKTADEFKVTVLDDRDTFDQTAFLVARRLATGRKTIRAALTAFRGRARYGYGRGGTSDFEAGRWEPAAGSFYRALESGLEPSYLYFGLYASHAKLGHAAQARWYLMMYCKSEGKNPAKLDAQALAYLREMPRSADTPEAFDLSRFEIMRDGQNWDGVIWELRKLVEAAPWGVEAYEMLADSYKAIGWDLFEENWRQRAKLARKTANDDQLHRRLLDALEGP